MKNRRLAPACGSCRCGGGLSFDGDEVGLGIELEAAVAGFTAGGVEGVDDLFAVAFIDDDAVHAKEPEVMADGGLGEFEFLAEAGDVSFTAGEEHNDLEPGFVRQEAEQLTEVVEGLGIGCRLRLRHDVSLRFRRGRPKKKTHQPDPAAYLLEHGDIGSLTYKHALVIRRMLE